MRFHEILYVLSILKPKNGVKIFDLRKKIFVVVSTLLITYIRSVYTNQTIFLY